MWIDPGALAEGHGELSQEGWHLGGLVDSPRGLLRGGGTAAASEVRPGEGRGWGEGSTGQVTERLQP